MMAQTERSDDCWRNGDTNMRYQVQQWQPKGKWWKDVESFETPEEAAKCASRVNRSRTVTFTR